MVTFCKTVIQYHNQKINIDAIHFSYSDFPTVMCTHLYVCMHLVLYSFITCVGSCLHHHSQDTEQLHHQKDSSCCPFVTTPTSLLFQQPLAKTNLFSISKILSF